jgi:hypothetical protein
MIGTLCKYLGLKVVEIIQIEKMSKLRKYKDQVEIDKKDNIGIIAFGNT